MPIQSADMVGEPSSGTGGGFRRAWITVAILALLSVTSFVDRHILVLLVEDLKTDLAITDMQFGFLVGPVFIITYNAVLIPLSFLVDRTNRKYLLLAGCLIWSVMTLASGFATSYEHLIIFRSGLAIGEALLAPVAMSIIGDLFTVNKRALPTAIFVAGSTVGSTSATVFGAMAYSAFGDLNPVFPGFGPLHAWRMTLIAVAVPSFLLGIAYLLVGANPTRGQADPSAIAQSGLLQRHLRDRGLVYLLTCLITGLGMLAGAGIHVWQPAYLMRHFGLDQVEAGYMLGSVWTIAGVVGLLSFPPIANWRARARDRSVAMADVTILSLVIAIPGLILVGAAESLALCLAGTALALLCLACASALPTQIIQIHTPSAVKGRITAFVLFFMFLISLGIGPVLVPLIATHIFSGNAAIGQALSVAGTIACGLAVLLLIPLRSQLSRIAHQDQWPTKQTATPPDAAILPDPAP